MYIFDTHSTLSYNGSNLLYQYFEDAFSISSVETGIGYLGILVMTFLPMVKIICRSIWIQATCKYIYINIISNHLFHFTAKYSTKLIKRKLESCEDILNSNTYEFSRANTDITITAIMVTWSCNHDKIDDVLTALTMYLG